MEWISVDEKVPMDSKCVLAYCEESVSDIIDRSYYRGRVYLLNYYDRHGWCSMGKIKTNVKYWMPLPPKPE